MRDPWPTFELGSGQQGYKRKPGNAELRGEGSGYAGFIELQALQRYISWIVYAQRGFDPEAGPDGAPHRWY